jgi:hypothetical protein
VQSALWPQILTFVANFANGNELGLQNEVVA